MTEITKAINGWAGGDGVWRIEGERHRLRRFGSQTDLIEKLDETDRATERNDGLGRGADLNWF